MKVKVYMFTGILMILLSSFGQASGFAQILLNDDEEETTQPIEHLFIKIGEREIPFKEALDMEIITMEFFKSNPEIYIVIRGDNLYRIALAHEIPLEALMEWNGLTGDLIHPGDELIVNWKEEDKPVFEEEPVMVASAVTATATTNVSEPAPSSGKEMLMTATAYTAYCKGCSGTTAYGIDLRANPDLKVIAVDPKVIPLGTRVWVEGYGEAIAGDVGGAIKGNKIDVFIPSFDQAMQWGVKQVKIIVLE